MQSLTPASDLHISPAGEGDHLRLDETFSRKTGSAQNIADTRAGKTGGSGLVVLAFLSVIGAGLFYSGYFERLRLFWAKPLEAYFLNAGVTLKKIVIRGQETLGDKAILAALGHVPGQSLFGFDAARAQKRLTEIGQVKTARVMRLLPSTLLVEIVERRPFARWMHAGRMDLIDESGKVLRPVRNGQEDHFPLVAGEGAARHAAHLVRALSVHETLARHIGMARRVARYRWDLHARSGALVKLPRENLALGLARLVELPGWQALLAQGNSIIDLRHPGQAFARQAFALSSAGRS